jgi:hypothetical protein
MVCVLALSSTCTTRRVQQLVLDAGAFAIEVQRHRGVLRHAQALLVEEAEVDLGAVVALVGGLLEPLRAMP